MVFTKGFKIGYLILLGVLFVCIDITLVVLWFSLDRYEKSSAFNVANRVFNGYFKEINAKKIFEFKNPALSEFETLDNLDARLNEITKDTERSIRIVPGEAENRKKFIVFSGDEAFAEFEIALKENTKRPLWELAQLSTVLGELESIDILASRGTEIYINGTPVDKSYMTGSFIGDSLGASYDKYTINGFIAKPTVEKRSTGRKRSALVFNSQTNQYSDMNVVTADILDGWNLFINDIPVDEKYIINDNISTPQTDRLSLNYKRYNVVTGYATDEPEVSVKSKSGKDGVLSGDDSLTFRQEIIYNNRLNDSYGDFAMNAAMTYARYMTNRSSLAQIRRFFATGTTIYEAMRTAEVYFYTPFIDDQFENVIAQEFYEHEDGTISCRVTLDHIIRRDVATYKFPLDVSLFIRESDGAYLIYDMITNE